MLYSFQLALRRYRIELQLDPSTLYSCLSNKPKQPCSPHPSKPCIVMLLLLVAQPLLSMHAQDATNVTSCYSLVLGYHIIIIVVDDMIIIMLTIFAEGWKVQAIPPRRFVLFETPRTRVPGIVSLDERASSCVGCYGVPLSYLPSFKQFQWWPKLLLPFANHAYTSVGSLLADVL